MTVSRLRHLSRPVTSFFHLQRWENYCLLALASLAFLTVVAVRSDAGATPLPLASLTSTAKSNAAKAGTKAMKLATVSAPTATATTTTKAAAVMPAAALDAKPRASEAAWRRRHELIKFNAAGPRQAEVMLLGDSITQGWEFGSQWQTLFPDISAVNAGIASDRAEHILWRVKDGLFAKARPKVVVLLAGINNLAMHDADKIAATQAATIRAIQARSPDTKILLMGVFPSGQAPDHARRAKIVRLNERLAKLADGERVQFLDIGSRLVTGNGSISKIVMFDYLHLTARGYRIWATAMGPKLREMLGETPRA